jgi:large subunit ribosomal protein L28
VHQATCEYLNRFFENFWRPDHLLSCIESTSAIVKSHELVVYFVFFRSSRLKATCTTVQKRNGASSMEMRARVCDLLGKTPNRQARVVTFSHRRIKKVQHVNLQWKRFFSEALNRNVKLRVSTKGIKTVDKMGGIDAAAKKFKVDLAKF